MKQTCIWGRKANVMKLNFNQAFKAALNKPENANAKQRFESFQFVISQEILGDRIKLGLSPKEAATKLGMSEEAYRGFENGINMAATEQEYESVHKKLVALREKPSQNVKHSAESFYYIASSESTFTTEKCEQQNSHASGNRLVNLLVMGTANERRRNYTYDGIRTSIQEKSEKSDEIKLSRLFANKRSVRTEEYRFAY